MKKILLSVSIIAAVAAVVFGITTAFFSDTETSTGNTFTAGELNLRFQVGSAPGPWTDVDGDPLFASTSIPFWPDMKPGDTGEKTVRLWVDDNPACGKVTVHVYEDQDNSCTEPELVDEDINGTTCSSSTDLGELNDAVNFAIWADTNCNNVYDPGETPLTQGTITGTKAYSIGELPLTEVSAQCYGIAYCFGAWNPLDGTCDGLAVNNAPHTDSFKADLIIEALQKRNQTFPEQTNPGICPPAGDWPIED